MHICRYNRCGSRPWLSLLTPAVIVLTLALFAGLAGCGGGGGGGNNSGTPVTVTGRVLRAETGLAPDPAATVTIGGTSVTTAADGTFTFNPPGNATMAMIAAQGSMT